MRYLLLTGILGVVNAWHKHITLVIEPGKAGCVYQYVFADAVIETEYQVRDSSRGDLFINFHLTDPEGHDIVVDYKEPENEHKIIAVTEGVHRFCFDNTLSTGSIKAVYLDILVDKDDKTSDYFDEVEMQLGSPTGNYMMRVRDIFDSLSRVQGFLDTARRQQEYHSAHEARDRKLAEETRHKVTTWSISVIVVMLIVSVSQVLLVKSLFKNSVVTQMNRS